MAVVVLLAGAAAHPEYALPGLAKSTVAKAGKVHCAHVTAKAFREFSESTWRLPAWERGKPPEKVIDAKRGKVRCAAGPGHRAAMRKRWVKDRRQFAAHRSQKLAERRRIAALTPYNCGSAGRFAVPCYVVACESGYSWSAYNSSGAAGAYQIMPEWGRPWPVTSTADKLAHHRLAAQIWDGGAGASNWVCAS